MQFPGFARPMHQGEEDAIDALLRAAFGTGDEATLVHDLRRGGDMAGEVVLPMGDAVIGYYALSQMRAPQGWLCLAPVAIHPDHQGRGFGRRMVGQLSEWARVSGQMVVVLGQVPFYQRAGFSQARAQGLSSPFPIEHTLLAGSGDNTPEGALAYPRPFGRG